MAEQYRWFVGIDWAIERHEICVLDSGGRVIDRRTVAHTGAGIAELVGAGASLSAAAARWHAQASAAAAVSTMRAVMLQLFGAGAAGTREWRHLWDSELYSAL